MKLPKLPKISFTRRPKKLNASAATARRGPAADDYYEDEPKTDLSSAFVVVLILHVVAIGGIYAFNSIKTARRGQDASISSASLAPDGGSLLAKGTPLEVPVRDTPELVPVRSMSTNSFAPVSKNHIHRVVAGETVTKVAAQYGVSAADLAEANGLQTTSALRAGVVLNIPTTKTPVKASPIAASEGAKIPQVATTRVTEPAATPAVAATLKASGKTYTVTKGDTAISIARKFGTSPDELLKLNKIEDPKKLQLGQTLKVPVKKAN